MAMPIPSAAILRFNSSVASSTSSRARALACSVTCFTAGPRPESLLGVGMTPPVDDLREHDADREGGGDHDERVRAALLHALRALRHLRAGGSAPLRAGLLVLRRVALGAGDHEARLQLAQEVGVLGDRLGGLRGHAVALGRLLAQIVELVGGGLHDAVALVHLLVGGSSPVAMRQMLAETRRAASVARAPIAAYRPVQSSFRSMLPIFTAAWAVETSPYRFPAAVQQTRTAK